MKRLRVHIIILLLILSLYSMGSVSPVIAQSSDTRTGSFTTDKGTAVSLEATLEHEPNSSPPQLLTNKVYNLEFVVTLTELGNETLDIHDMEFTIEITTPVGFGSKSIFSSFYFDSVTVLDEANSTAEYNLKVFITGNLDESTANMDITFKTTENINNRPDPTTEFTGIGYELQVSPGSLSSDITFTGNATETRDMKVFTDEGSEVSMSVDLDHDGLDANKPSIQSNQFYNLSVNITLLDLGADALDLHDVEIEVLIEDTSIASLIPRSDPVRYFSAYSASYEGNDGLVPENNSRVFEFALVPYTNINDTEVELQVKFKFKEDIEGAFDPTNEYNLVFETLLNKNKANEGFGADTEETPLQLAFPMFVVFVSLPLIRRKIRNKK